MTFVVFDLVLQELLPFVLNSFLDFPPILVVK